MKRFVVLRVERLSGRRWLPHARKSVRTRRGRARWAARLGARGRYRVRALTRADSRHASGRSAPVELLVR